MGWYSPESAGAAVVRSVLGLPKHALSCHVMALLLGLEAVWSELVDLELDASPRAAELLALITGQVSTAESVLPRALRAHRASYPSRTVAVLCSS